VHVPCVKEDVGTRGLNLYLIAKILSPLQPSPIPFLREHVYLSGLSLMSQSSLIGTWSRHLTPVTLLKKNPGTLIGSSGSTTSSSSQSPSPPSGGGSLPTGVIVGTIVGGVAVIAIAVLGTIYWQRQHSNVSPATKSVPKLQNEALKLSSDDGTSVLSSMPETPIFKSGIYNQEDSTPFLGYQLAQSALDVSTQQTLTPNNGAANTLANMQMSRPLRYNGLAIV